MLATLLFAASMAVPDGNMLLGREAQGRGLSGAPAATDGLLAPEGAAAAAALAAGRVVRLVDPEAFLAVDLGAPRPVGALLLQADAGDTYLVEASVDGRTWTGILRVEAGDALYGMRTRRAELPGPREARFLLVHAEGGDGTYAVGELAAFAEAPGYWREPVATAVTEKPIPEDELLVAVRGLIALAAALLLAWGVVLRRRGAPARHQKLRDRALAALGLLSAAAFFNFGLFHFGRFVHVWDAYHYVLGAKYFPELGYTGLYEATLAAERAAGLLPPGTALPVRDLATNAIGTSKADDALATWRPRLGARWEAFVNDVLWFRTRTTPEHFRRILVDHGYNATPAWGILGGAFARAAGPVTDRSVGLLSLLDPALLLGAWLLLWRAFGWRAACVALVFWGTNFPGRFFWNGGSFLRMDWLAAAMGGIALLKLGRPRLAGSALASAALLRIFPGALLLALGAAAAWRWARERNRSAVREELLVAHGALLSVLVAVPLSLVASGGFSTVRWTAWAEFADNSRKHLATPLANNVGLGTLVTWRTATRAEALVKNGEREPLAAWKETKRSALGDSRPVRMLLAAASLAAVGFAFRRRPAWTAAAAGAGLVFVLADLTCYYASILLLLGLLSLEREEAGVVTSLLAAATCAAPLLFPWEDDRSVFVSALILGAFGLLLALLAREKKPRGSRS
ncbi:MAG: hypothetical protein IPF66_12845 [Holophagales bacterium]|nr:hypothetical protein [Holophagales bacterium]